MLALRLLASSQPNVLLACLDQVASRTKEMMDVQVCLRPMGKTGSVCELQSVRGILPLPPLLQYIDVILSYVIEAA